MYGSSPLRSTLNTNIITGSGMCKVCTGTRCKGVVTGSPTYIMYTYTLEQKYRKIWKHSNPEGLKTSSPVGRCRMVHLEGDKAITMVHS